MVSTKSMLTKPARMNAGFLIPIIAEFGASLEALGYSRLMIGGYTDSARHFATWILGAGLQLGEFCKDTADHFARHHCHCAGVRRWNGVSRKYARRAGRFVSFLAERRLIAPAPCDAAEIVHPHILGYRRFAPHRLGSSSPAPPPSTRADCPASYPSTSGKSAKLARRIIRPQLHR